MMLSALALLAMFAACPLLADQAPERNVLIVNSYDSEFTWTRDQNRGFIEKVHRSHPEVHFFIEYLDAKRIDVTLHRDAFATLLKDKFRKMDIAVIYTTDDIALEFVQSYAPRIGMSKAIIVASGINNVENLSRKAHPTTVGIHEVESAGAMVKVALRQNPGTKRIVILCDQTDVGQAIADDIDIQTRRVTNLPIERLPASTWHGALERIAGYDTSTIFLLGLYAVDSSGYYVQPYNVATEMAAAARSPIYAFHDIFTVSPDIVGGYVNSGIDQGHIAGDIATQVLGGRTPDRIVVTKPGFSWVFNHRAMKRFGIPESNLPEGSVPKGMPVNFIAEHLTLVISVLVGIAAQTLLIIFLLFNIRSRVTATKALMQSESNLRLLLENSPLAVFVADKDGRIVLLNSQFRKMLGYNATDVRTMEHLRDCLLPNEEYRAKVMQRMDENAKFAAENGILSIPVEFTARAKDGHNVEVEMYYAATGDMLFRILHDVTERNRGMRELRQASIAATAANEAKSRFIANVSHEIRTPMNGILGMVQLLHETALTADQRDCIETIGDSCSLLLTVINDILDLSKIEAGQMKLLPEVVNVQAFLKSVAAIARTPIAAKHLEFVTDWPGDLPGEVLMDPNRVKQVLLNLLMNALKFTDKGRVEFRAHFRQPAPDHAFIAFSVADTGIGISPEVQSKIFEPFIQGDTSHTRKFGGTGLGLAISRKLVRMMGSDIALESDEGKGSTFSFEIEVEVVPESPHKPSVIDDRLDPGTAHNFPLEILVAEDNAVNQKVVGMMLHKMGYAFDVASDGIEALEATGSKRYDVILMDVQMPRMDGITAAVKIRSTLPQDEQPHIIALTAHAMSDDAQRCLDAGMNGHLAKPLKIASLKEALIGAYAEIHTARNAG